ncbi:MAG: UbiA family prenyltransferase [Chthoniobacteraceae bacterium]
MSSWLRSELLFLLKVSRPGFWLTAIWFYLLPVGGVWVFNSWTFWLGCFYVTFPLGLLIYGWNDLVDAETDRLNPRKDTYLFGARPSAGQMRRLPWVIAGVQLPFFALFVALEGAHVWWWLVALLVSTAIYNGPRGGLKGRPPFEMLNQAGYLLVFVLASWLTGQPQLPWPTFVLGALFAMHSHLFGQIMDVVPDRASGRRTTAVCTGIVRAKYLLAAMLLVEAMLAAWYPQDWKMAACFVLGAGWFLADALVLWRDRLYTTGQMRLFLLGWNAVALLTMPLVWWSATLTRSLR